MHVLVAGASGFLGSHLVEALRADGDEVRTLTRSAPTSADQVAWDPASGKLDPSALDGVDVVVNVAGSPTIGNPHSGKWARNLRESRVTTTRTLAEAIAEHPGRPAFLAQNGVGWYGDHGPEVITETSDSRGDAFMTTSPATGRTPPRRPSRRAPACASCGPSRSTTAPRHR